MILRLRHILFFILIATTALTALDDDKIKVMVQDRVIEIPYVVKRDLVFISSKQLALSLLGNYYYNKDAGKVEMKFKNFSLKFTGRTQFIILSPRNQTIREVAQLPLSTLMVNGDVFIPLKYSLKYVSKAYGKNLYYDGSKKIISDVPTTENATAYGGTVKTPKPTFANSDYNVSDLTVEEKANGDLIKLKANKKLGKIHCSIHENICYLFFYDISVDPNITAGFKPAGMIKSATRKEINKSVQLEFRLKGEYKDYEAFQDNYTGEILVTLHKKLVEEKEEEKLDLDKWIFDTIVLDAGHGGKDPGAIGITGVREKDVNLGITRKLGALIKKEMPELNVVYTRDKDNFVELHQRGKIANKSNGKLFISIHCNSLGKKKPGVRGFEVYLLRPGRTDEAIGIAEFENSVIKFEENKDIYQELNDENFIYVSMAHASYMRYSEKFSDYLNEEWKKSVAIPSRGIKQAGFYVLVGASMPGVLIESGYLSNRSDERYLKSSKGQQQIANSILKAIKKYKEYYDSSFVNFKKEN